MAVREPRRPGEGVFDWLDRTTVPGTRMHVISGACDCLHHFEPSPWSHSTTPHIREEQS